MKFKLIKSIPIIQWIHWFFKTQILLYKSKNKHLKIGVYSYLFKVKIGNYNTIYENVKINNSKIGNYVYISNDCRINTTTIGNFCSIGPSVRIGLGAHPTDHLSTFPAFYSKKTRCQISFVNENKFEEYGNVEIGNDVWIGYNAIIMSGVKIGNGAIVAAGAIVTKDVNPYSIVGGIPAKHIKYRFSESDIEKILLLKWWDNDIKWIKENASQFYNVNNFL